MPDELTAILSADLPHQDDAGKLASVLYERCYTCSVFDPPEPVSTNGSDDLTPLLDAANQGVTTWDEGWRIDQALEEGRVLARKGGSARSFRAGEYILHSGIGGTAKWADPISVLLPAGCRDLQPGFWFAFGTTVTEFDPVPGGLRFYWNISAAGAPHLVEAVTRELNRFQVPFHLKCPDRSSGYPRRDAAVLYVARRYYPITAFLLERVHDDIRQWLSPGTPLFTKHLADGLALAEDPGQSFGQHRCRILAAAMTESYGKPVEERLLAVTRHFEENHLQSDRPWLNPESTAQYPFPFPNE